MAATISEHISPNLEPFSSPMTNASDHAVINRFVAGGLMEMAKRRKILVAIKRQTFDPIHKHLFSGPHISKLGLDSASNFRNVGALRRLGN